MLILITAYIIGFVIVGWMGYPLVKYDGWAIVAGITIFWPIFVVIYVIWEMARERSE